jgi:hypothetical protein
LGHVHAEQIRQVTAQIGVAETVDEMVVQGRRPILIPLRRQPGPDSGNEERYAYSANHCPEKADDVDATRGESGRDQNFRFADDLTD